MDIRPLAPGYAVSPQIEPDDLPAIAAAGFRTVVCNRPDHEVPHELGADALRAATEAAGLRFVLNPVTRDTMTQERVDAQRAALEDGPVLAYCQSGTRCSMLWALAEAGRMPAADILAAARGAGYDLSPLLPRLAQA